MAAAGAGGTGERVAPAGGWREVRLAWRLSPHALRLITLALTGLIIAVLARRPEFAGVAAPGLLLLAGRRLRNPPSVRVRVTLSAPAVVEAEPAEVAVAVRGHGGHSVDLRLLPGPKVAPAGAVPRQAGDRQVGDRQARDRPARDRPAGDRPAGDPGGPPGPRGAAPGPGAARNGTGGLVFSVRRAGRRQVGGLEIVLRDRLRLTEGRAIVSLPEIDCYPRPAEEERLVTLSRLLSRLGEHASRSGGEGVEFTGVRAFVPGDRQRRINWPATTRRGQLQLSTFSAELTQTVVIIADASAEVPVPAGTTLDLALRGAAAAARAYLAARDRVAFVRYTGGVRWLAPAPGSRQYYRIMDAMLGPHEPFLRSAISRLPRSALPNGSLILVFSPLLDRNLIESLRDLRERGFTLLIVDVL